MSPLSDLIVKKVELEPIPYIFQQTKNADSSFERKRRAFMI